MSEVARGSALAPFSIRNYRFQWPADLFTSWAFEMETLILGWYMLAATGSVLLLSLIASLNYTGTLIAPMFGVVGDRIGHRHLLAMMRATYAVLAGTLMTLALTGLLGPVHVFIIVAIMGLVRPSDLGVRAALVATIMPADRLVGAISLSRTTMDTARIAGALSGAGLLASFGIGPAYVAVFSLYILGTLLTLGVLAPSKSHPMEASADGLRSPIRDLRAGVAHVWMTPRMRAAVLIAFLANLTAYPFTNGLLPYIAQDIYRTDQTGLGYLSASFAVGSLAGSVIVSLIGGGRVERVMIGATAAWYAVLLVFVQVRTVPAAVACLVLAGFSQSLTMITITVILMRSASAQFRGRVMGVRMLAIYGLPIGLVAAGSLIDLAGFVATGTFYLAAGLALLLAIALHWRSDLWHASAPAHVK